MLLSDVAFQSTLPARGATSRRQSRQSRQQFQSTLPARGATRTATHKRRRERFQSTLPARGATLVLLTLDKRRKFQSTLPARGATTDGDAQAPPRKISIHAPRTGSDKPEKPPAATSRRNFNPRSPHGERQKCPFCIRPLLYYFNPRSPHGERHKASINSRLSELISIHAPRTGSDVVSRYSRRRRLTISIHAPRTGSDRWQVGLHVRQGYFNPRSPHGERQSLIFAEPVVLAFQSTLPARGATVEVLCRSRRFQHFNPRSPHGERH